MRRLFWLAVGATVAVVVVRQGRAGLRRSSRPEGIAGRWPARSERCATFAEDVREAVAEREQNCVPPGVEPGTWMLSDPAAHGRHAQASLTPAAPRRLPRTDPQVREAPEVSHGDR